MSGGNEYYAREFGRRSGGEAPKARKDFRAQLLPETVKEGSVDINARYLAERMTYSARREAQEAEYARIRRESSLLGSLARWWRERRQNSEATS